jgi:hypothetical protein
VVNASVILSGAVSLQADALLNVSTGLNISGAVDGAYKLSGNGGGNFTFGNVGQSTRVAGIDITSAADVTFSGNVASSANVSMVANGNVAINGVMNVSGANATASMLRINTTGSVSEGASGQILAGTLALLGAGGNFTLTAASNNVSTIAADTGSLSYVNAGNLTVGAVNLTGITATGPISISTVSGDLTISENIATSSTSTNAIWLNAGSSAEADRKVRLQCRDGYASVFTSVHAVTRVCATHCAVRGCHAQLAGQCQPSGRF